MVNVIFDRNIFHGDKFDTIEKSNLLTCVQNNKIKIVYTSRFIEETLGYALNCKLQFERHWKFLLQLNKNWWFNEPDVIVAKELCNKAQSLEYYLIPVDKIENIIYGCESFLDGKYDRAAFEAVLKDYQQIRENREQFKNTRKQWRLDGKTFPKDFDQCFESEVERFIQNDFMQKHQNSSEYLIHWQSNRQACKFTEAYIRSQVALVYLAKINTDSQPKLDDNDGVDAEQLAYLIWCDIFVSDEKGFMKDCFSLLYKGKDKKYFTLSEFLNFLV